ncbi:MAG: signal recognition particle-docking protein FtsY [Myxococcota bacterium]
MQPVEGDATTAAADPTEAAPTATPELVAGGVGIAIAIAVILAIVVNRTTPRSTIRRLPLDESTLPTEEIFEEGAADDGSLDVADRTTEVPPDHPEGRSGVVALFQAALGRSRELLRSGFDRVFGRQVDAATLDALEEVLLRADVGVATTGQLLTKAREAAAGSAGDPAVVRSVLKAELRRVLDAVHRPFRPEPSAPWVVLVVGVNGSGKTTTIGKLAARLKGEGYRVLLAAGDTYRAAAEQQLGVWAERAGVEILALDEGADPAAVAYKAVERAKAEKFDVVLVDTAGRLQTRKPLMEQLGKVRRVLDKAVPGAPHETLLVLDGTMGQNAMSQAKLFHEATPVTGVVVTKLDGTAKGGMVFAIATELGLPVKLVGLGEKVGDLRDFDPEAFVDALV